MEEIEEVIVSFDTANKLYRKGFPQGNSDYAYTVKECYSSSDYSPKYNVGDKVFLSEGFSASEIVDAPSLELAHKWIRDSHYMCISPYRTAAGYLYTIDRIPYGTCIYDCGYIGDDEASGQFTTWEKAMESAINKAVDLIGNDITKEL